MVLKWLTPANESLKEIVSYYKKEHAENTARKIVNSIFSQVEKLKKFPELAAVEPLLNNRIKVYRSLVVTKTYKVIYFIDNDTIYIADIWDCRQSPESNVNKIK